MLQISQENNFAKKYMNHEINTVEFLKENFKFFWFLHDPGVRAAQFESGFVGDCFDELHDNNRLISIPNKKGENCVVNFKHTATDENNIRTITVYLDNNFYKELKINLIDGMAIDS